MELLKNTWRNVLMDLVGNAQYQIRITSPFVKANICQAIFENKKKQTKFELITAFNLQNAFAGALDLSALQYILDHGGIVKSHPKLHAKMYIFDNSKAVITSGNLTNGGLQLNVEYGILIEDNAIVTQINQDFLNISNNLTTGIVKNEHIVEALTIIENMPRREIPNMGNVRLENFETSTNHLQIDNFERMIENTLNGWLLDIFKCFNNIETQEVTLSQLYGFEAILKQKYPNNRHIKDKIRQQIQQLREVGLVEFVGNGKYRKLWI